jgi:hypothetical protein
VRPKAVTGATAVVLAVLTLVACGKRGSPVPPQGRVPQAVRDLTAVARDNAVELTWTPARRRVDGSLVPEPGMAKLYRTEDDGHGEPRAAMRVNDRIAGYTELGSFRLEEPASPEVQGGRILYRDRRDLAFGRRYTYVVLTSDAQGRTSPPSPRVSIHYIAPPGAPTGLQAEGGDAEARLAWQPVTRLADGSPLSGTIVYEVLRASDATSEPTPVGRAEGGETTFVDRGLANDRTYHYAVRAQRTAGGGSTSGPASARVAVTPAKTEPPAPPTNLAAVASRGEVRLSWTPSPAPDVAAYIVYRAAPGGPFVRIGSVPPPATTFVDRNVPAGRYRYAVTAQDASLRANESPRAGEVTVAVP